MSDLNQWDKKEFMQNLIAELNRENEERIHVKKTPLNVCFMVSVVEQHIEDCTSFIDDIAKHEYDIWGYEEDFTNCYTNGKIKVYIFQEGEETVNQNGFITYPNYCNYHYEIKFLFDERTWGYCECEPDDEGYNEEHQCCGQGCDWFAPSFSIAKVENLGEYKWDGYARDYWSYQEEFNLKEENKNQIVEAYEREMEKESLKKQIAELQSKLNELE